MASQDAAATLSYAVRLPVVGKYLGQLALMLAALTLPPLAVAVGYGEYSLALHFVPVLAFLLAAGIPLARLPAPERLQTNEALTITALAFVLAPLLMAYPMMGAGLSFVDGWFEAVSGITTTGLTTLTQVADKPRGFLFLRAWMQWYGGLGIVVLSVALLMEHRLATRRLLQATGTEDTVATTRSHARRVLTVYLLLTAGGALALVATGLAPFAAVTQTLAAVSTGGFSTFNDSMAAMSTPTRGVLMALALLGAVSLPLYYRSYHAWREPLRDLELRALVAGCLLTGGLMTLLLHGQAGMPTDQALLHGFLLGASAQTTTGFASLSVSHLPSGAKALLLLSMVVGGSVGSTAGGIKLLRLLVFLRLVQHTLKRAAMPAHAVVPPQLGGQKLDPDDINRVLLVIVLFAAVIALSWLPFLMMGYAPIDALFEVVSATATVGLSAGVLGPHLPAGLKGVLMADMLFGRLEIIAVLILLFPGTWHGRRTESL
ncbi:MAG TPA: potassium transporter TrkG [Gammaproteobacteria bacterium]|nr:potassium transporter TrkG [Gammaproteobacteria bacterium]